MTCEVTDAVPDSFPGRAFRVSMFLEMTDPRQPDAQALLTVRDGEERAYAGDTHAYRSGFDDPLGTMLEWSREERIWVPIQTNGKRNDAYASNPISSVSGTNSGSIPAPSNDQRSVFILARQRPPCRSQSE